jgi:hypothetical protein
LPILTTGQLFLNFIFYVHLFLHVLVKSFDKAHQISVVKKLFQQKNLKNDWTASFLAILTTGRFFFSFLHLTYFNFEIIRENILSKLFAFECKQLILSQKS